MKFTEVRAGAFPTNINYQAGAGWGQGLWGGARSQSNLATLDEGSLACVLSLGESNVGDPEVDPQAGLQKQGLLPPCPPTFPRARKAGL